MKNRDPAFVLTRIGQRSTYPIIIHAQSITTTFIPESPPPLREPPRIRKHSVCLAEVVDFVANPPQLRSSASHPTRSRKAKPWSQIRGRPFGSARPRANLRFGRKLSVCLAEAATTWQPAHPSRLHSSFWISGSCSIKSIFAFSASIPRSLRARSVRIVAVR